ncbi:MAG TPA: nuclear transport factor 2 family protein [Baekduia sp.]|uniref:nuclear transport factor 2 family protein n=1 Tax=Baekduia sp. TaxID=2600305 RepID=UPI002C8A1534|nr:nuclear transport factor 2 family protein [Baekduia sp.]HMJ37884.1 nuclear transport factor 2 family protein [Baekduia sp.]
MIAVDSPLAAYRAAAEAHDVPAMLACMAPEVVLKSPITDRFAFSGHPQMRDLLEDVHAVIDDVRYVADAGDDRTRLLALEGRVGRQRLDEAMLVTLDDDGLITHMQLFIRPLPGLTAMAAALGPRVAGRHSRTRAFAVRAMIAPLAFMTRHGEGVGSRLAAP